jgi:hypothetical protein
MVVCFVLCAAGFGQDSSMDSKASIERVLRTQQEAWNRHDLDAFMQGYWNAPELTFFSGVKESKGWQAALDRYRATYASPGHEMGKLDFGFTSGDSRVRCSVRAWRLATYDV